MDELKWARRVLGVSPRADEGEIREAFRRGAKQHHPDAGGSAESFADLRRAYDILRTACRSKPRNRPESRPAHAATTATSTMSRDARSTSTATRTRVRSQPHEWADQAGRETHVDPQVDRIHRTFADILNQKLGYI